MQRHTRTIPPKVAAALARFKGKEAALIFPTGYSANVGTIAGLMRSGRTRLADSQNQSNSLESRFDLAYNAAHALSLAALRRLGYRAENRYIVFQVLPHALALGPAVWRVLAKCHEVRNLGEYEGDLNIDERLVADLITACKAVVAALEKLRA